MATELRAAHSNRNEAGWSALSSGPAKLHADAHAQEQGNNRVGVADIARSLTVEQREKKSGKNGKQANEHCNHDAKFRIPSPIGAQNIWRPRMAACAIAQDVNATQEGKGLGWTMGFE